MKVAKQNKDKSDLNENWIAYEINLKLDDECLWYRLAEIQNSRGDYASPLLRDRRDYISV